MTVQELLVALSRNSGGDTSVYPYTVNAAGAATFDLTSDGAVYGLELLNRAYKTLNSWKRPDGRLLKFSTFNRFTYLQVADLTASVFATDENAIVLESFSHPPESVSDLRGWWLEVGGGTYLVVSMVSAGATSILALDRDIDSSVVAGDDVTLYSRRFALLPFGTTDWYFPGQAIIAEDGWPIITVREVNLIGSGQNQRLSLRARDDLFYEASFIRGYPTLYDIQSGGLEFNYPPLADALYRVDYFSQPEELTAAAQEPLIPRAWHEAIWMIAASIVTEDGGDTERSSRLLQKINGLVASQMQELEHITDYTRAVMRVEDSNYGNR